MANLTEKQVGHWQNQIDLSLAWRQPYEDTWCRIIDYLKGSVVLDDEDAIYINLVRPHVNVVIPAVYSRNPDVLVLPGRSSMVEDELVRKKAEVVQNVLKYYLRELDIKAEVKLCILDAIITGMAWIKTGYETEFETVEEELAEETETMISKALKYMGIKQEEKEEEEFDGFDNQKILYERPWALRTSVFDMIVPGLSRRPEELRWIGERIILPYDDVIANPDYNVDGLKPSVNANDLLQTLRGAKYNKLDFATDISYSILYEIYDRKTRYVYTLADGHPRALQCKPSKYTFLDSKYHPYLSLRFNEIIDEFYPQSDIEPAEEQLLELSEVRTKLNKHMRRYNRKYITRPGAFTPQAKADLRRAEDGTIVEHTDMFSETPLPDILHPVTDAAVPAEIYSVETRVKDDIFGILGTADYQSKASGGARTATEASIMATQSRFKVEERIDAVGIFVEHILRNLCLISRRFQDRESIAEIVGDDDAMYWDQTDDDNDLRNEFAFEVIYGSSAPISREIEKEQFMKFYAMAVNDPYYNQVKLRLELVRKSDLTNPETWLDDKIANMIESQRRVLARQGLLLEGVQNRAETPGSVGRVPDMGKRGERGPNDSSGLPERSDIRAQIPGGPGGTALARSPY